MQRKHWLASVVIVVALGLQGAIFPLRTSLCWPFLTYPMYSIAYKKAFTNEYVLYAEMSDGREVAITPEYAGLGYFAWENRYLHPLREEEPGGYEAVREMVERREGVAMTRVRLETIRYEIDDENDAIVTIEKPARYYDKPVPPQKPEGQAVE